MHSFSRPISPLRRVRLSSPLPQGLQQTDPHPSYSVFANVEASGTTSTLVRDTANLRMQAAGVHLVSFFAIFSDLMRDWRNPFPGVEKVIPIINDYMPAYGYLMRGHASAILQNGTVLPGSEKYI